MPSAAGEYTPEQRASIDAQLAAGEKSLLHGPFENAAMLIAHVMY